MNVLMLTPDYPPHSFGGIAGYVKKLSQQLVSFGVEVHVIVVRCDYFITDKCTYEDDAGIHVYRFEDPSVNSQEGNFVNRWISNSLVTLKKIRKIVTKVHFDLIHNNDLFTTIILDDLRDKIKAPIVNTIHGISAPVTLLEDGARRYGYLSSHGVITVSYSMQRQLFKRYGYIDSLKVIHLGIEECSYPERKLKNITFAGRLIEDKGADILIKAIAILKQANSLNGYCIKIIGDGDQRAFLESLVSQFDLQNEIEFCGYRPNEEAKEIIKAGTIHVVPSRFEEPFGISATEGMAHGALTIVSNRGGLIEFVTHNKTGLVFESENEKDLAKMISAAIKDRVLRKSCVQNAYSYAESHTWREVAMNTVEYYETIKDIKYSTNRIR